MKKIKFKSIPLVYFIMATLLFSSCTKINALLGKDGEDEQEQEQEQEKEEEQETIYDIQWAYKIPDGEWLKLYPMYDSLGFYISDTCIAKTIPSGGTVSWSINSIEGEKPSIQGAGENKVIPRFYYAQALSDTTTSRWELIATVNKGTENEKSIKGEYYSFPASLYGDCIMRTELDTDEPSIFTPPIYMKLGDTIKAYTVKIPEDHKSYQTTSSWHRLFKEDGILEEVNRENDIYKIILPYAANWCYITATKVGSITDNYIQRKVIVSE